jgi:hypothetical protein
MRPVPSPAKFMTAVSPQRDNKNKIEIWAAQLKMNIYLVLPKVIQPKCALIPSPTVPDAGFAKRDP